MLGLEGIGVKTDVDGAITIMRDPASGSILVHEQCYVFNRRTILMQPDRSGINWTVQYFELPDRRRVPPFPPSSACEGFADGKLYFSIDGVTYAVPVDRLKEETSLEFGIG
jgi:hypothetical protein